MCKDPDGRAANLDPPVLFPDHPPTDRRQETAALSGRCARRAGRENAIGQQPHTISVPACVLAPSVA